MSDGRVFLMRRKGAGREQSPTCPHLLQICVVVSPHLVIGMTVPLPHTRKAFRWVCFSFIWLIGTERWSGLAVACREEFGVAERIIVCFERNQVAQKGNRATSRLAAGHPHLHPILKRGQAQRPGVMGQAGQHLPCHWADEVRPSGGGWLAVSPFHLPLWWRFASP